MTPKYDKGDTVWAWRKHEQSSQLGHLEQDKHLKTAAANASSHEH